MAPSERRRVRIVVIALLVLWYCWPLADLSRVFGFGNALYGFASDGAVITRVERGGPAERAGLHVGDRIIPNGRQATGLGQYSLIRGASAHVGDSISLKVASGSQTRIVTFKSGPESVYVRALIALRFFLSFLIAGVAAALLLMRPELATWGFFLYCLCVINLPGTVLSYVVPWSVRSAVVLQGALFGNVSLVGGMVFAWTFTNGQLTRAVRTIVLLALAAAIVTTGFDAYGTFVSQGRATDMADDVFAGCVVVAMFAGFIYSYGQEGGGSRQRLKWMIAALLVSIPARFIDGWFFPVYLSYGQHVFLISLQAVLPLTAAYAMFRTRVVDIRFVISRTLVYATVTAIIVGLFSLLDAVLSHAFAESSLGFGIDITVALVLGFGLNAMHHRIDSLIDRTLFRERHDAELRLARGAAAVIHATDVEAVNAILVRLPVEVLGLTGAASYRWTDGHFIPQTIAGEIPGLPHSVDRNDQVVLCLRADLEPVRLEDAPLSALHAVQNAVVAMPVAMRGEVTGFVIYGAHRDGADIDPDEERALVPLTTSAATALDHIDAQILRNRVATLEAMLEPSVRFTP